MGLLPLEFSDCLLDSPYFRENLRAHEKQLDQTATDIKGIIANIQDVLDTARQLSKAKRTLASSLANFQFDCIGTSLTDDEVIIANSVKQFSIFLYQVDDELERLLDRAHDKFIAPLANFRKEQIGSVRKTKKDFDKATARFCSAQDRYISLSAKKEESLAEAAEAVRFERRNLNESSLEYVYLMHVVQEKKKFEFVEALLYFMRSWANYYRHGHSVSQDSAAYMNDLQARVQKTRDNFSATSEQYDSLKQKMLSGNQDPGLFNKMYTRQGYLYVQNKKNIIGSQWSKHYCQYQARTHTLTMIPYSQLQGKITTTESIKVTSCVCKEEAAEKFRFIVTGEDINNQGVMLTHTLQTMSEYERKHWVEAMGGTWPALSTLQRIRADSVEDNLNSVAFSFLKDCLLELETRGLTDQGLYRVGGVLSKVKKLLNLGLDPQPGDGPLELNDPKQWESKTIASAVKQYFRDLSKPLLTHQLYPEFVEAIKHESELVRVQELQKIVRKLPVASREILKVLIRHLSKVAAKSDSNLMTAANIGVCFGPTLLRPREETVATIMDIKFCNEVVQILIENCDNFFPPSSSVESSPEVSRTPISEPDGSMLLHPRDQRGSSTPKRTHSFSSFSQLSTNSLPDIKEFKESKLSIAGTSTTVVTTNINGSATTERIRSRSTQHNNPIVITGPSSITVRPKNLYKSSTQDDLMASLEFMNSLAADLPSGQNNNINNNSPSNGLLWLTAASPLKRSHTVQARRIVKVGSGNVIVKTANQYPPPTSFVSTGEVMRKPPLPKLSLASPSSTSTSFTMSVPVPQQQYQHPSHFAILPQNVSGVPNYRNNNHNLTPTVKAILSPTSEQMYWPRSQQVINQYDTNTPKHNWQTELYVRDIPLSDSRNTSKQKSEPEPPVPPRSSSEGPSCSDTPPPLPVRKFRRVYTTNDVISHQHHQDMKEDIYQRLDKPTKGSRVRSSSTTQTSPRLYRTTLSVDSGVMMGSPSPPTDSGIGVSPPTQVRQVQQQQQQNQKVVTVNKDENDEELVRFGLEEINLRRCRRVATSSDDTASLCSSALSVESDTSGSRYDNVLKARISLNGTEPVVSTAKTSTLVAAAAEIAAASYLTASTPTTTAATTIQTGDEDGDDEDEGSNSDSDNIDLNSYSEDELNEEEEPNRDTKSELALKEKVERFHKPALRLPAQRNSGPYENFKHVSGENKDKEERLSPCSSSLSAEESSSSHFSSNSSSPKLTQTKKVLRSSSRRKDAKITPIEGPRPDLPPRENVSLGNVRIRLHKKDGQVTLNPANDPSIRHFLAAGQTSNV